jgi:general secretion pathway protein D
VQSVRATPRPVAPTMLPTVRPPQPAGSDGEEDGTNLAPPAFNLGSGGLGNGALGNGARAGTPARGDALPPPSAAAGGTPAVKIVADTRNNAVMIYSTFALFKRVREVLRSLDVPQAQVVIEATVAEVNLTDDLEKGVQWYLQSSNLTARSSSDPKPVDGARSGAFIHGSIPLGNVQVDVVINALQEITTVKVISSPYLTVVDGKTARLVIGDQIPFSTRTQNATLSTGATTVTEEVTVKDTGIILEVTPRIRADNSVVLNVNQSVSKPQDSAQHGNLTPVISTREVKSDIVVQSGRTILLAGLIQDRLDKTENGIPVARNLPVVGHLFKQTTDKGTRVELIVMITPRVIRSASQIENIARLLRAQQQIR